MAMSEKDPESMNEVPPKNDQSLVFGKKERFRLYINGFLKALLPAVLPQLIWLISFGQLMIALEPDFVRDHCNDAKSWVSLIRCEQLRGYSGVARTSAGALALSELMLCMLLSSISFLHKTKSAWDEARWERNGIWLLSLPINIVILAVYLVLSLERGSLVAQPWYFFVIVVVSPFLCLVVHEVIKANNRKHVKRAVMMRRLVGFALHCVNSRQFAQSSLLSLQQFETRLGMWSPK